MKERDIMKVKTDIITHHLELRHFSDDDLKSISEENQILYYEMSDLLESTFGQDCEQYKQLLTKIFIQASRSEGIKRVLIESNTDTNERMVKSETK